MSTNVSVVMLALNEADNIEVALDSAEQCFDELVLVDGGSTDGTVETAEGWCAESGKEIQVLESSEREYLLEGSGTQRRRGADLAENDYILAMDADVRVEVKEDGWFEEPFRFWAYTATRTQTSGVIDADWRLYHKDPPLDEKHICRWRGIVHEELRTPRGTHVSDVYLCSEAPIVYHQTRDATVDVLALNNKFPATFERGDRSLKKQHFLLAQAMASSERRYLHRDWEEYFHLNKALVLRHAEEIAEDKDLPLHIDERADDVGVKDVTPADWWDNMETGEPIIGFERDSITDYIRKQILI